MPPFTSSRRKASRRQNSEDIEESRSSQVRRPDDDVSDDDQPIVKVKHEKKAKKKVVDDEVEDDPPVPAATYDDDDDDGDTIDVENFSDQSLNRADMTKVGGMASDWESMASQIEQHFGMYKEMGAAIAETGEKDIASSEELQDLDSEVREFFDVCSELRIQAQSLDFLRQRIALADPVIKPHVIYESKVQELLEEYAGKTSRQKYLKNKNYVQFHTAIWDVHNLNEPMPPLTEFLLREDGDESDGDDVEVGGVTQNYLCPLTLRLLENPVTSKICGHSYSKASIDGYCAVPNQLYKCPHAGCNKKFKRADCEQDKELAKNVKKYGYRKDIGITNQANDDDDDEVVE